MGGGVLAEAKRSCKDDVKSLLMNRKARSWIFSILLVLDALQKCHTDTVFETIRRQIIDNSPTLLKTIIIHRHFSNRLQNVASWYRPSDGKIEELELFKNQLEKVKTLHKGNKPPFRPCLG